VRNSASYNRPLTSGRPALGRLIILGS